MKVSMSENGRNSVIVNVNGEQILFSYCTAIAKIKEDGSVELDSQYWDYSNATGKHRNAFLGGGIADCRKAIESCEYKLVNLN